MGQTAAQVRWNIRDLEVLPQSEGIYYELQEYWIADRMSKRLEIYPREKGQLMLHATLLETDELTSPLLPGFNC